MKRLFIFSFLLTGLAGGCIGKACATAEDMADQTIFNADKNVWTYEEFHRQHSQYQQYVLQQAEAEAQIELMEAAGTTRGQRYDNLIAEAAGVRQMRRRIAANYNAMSDIAYQGLWKSSGLPEKLE